MTERDDVLGLILAGGQARRMGGVDKAFVPLLGRPLIAHVVERLGPQVGRLALSANGDPERFSAFGLPVVADPVTENCGPLAGVAAGLLHAATLAPPPRFVATIAVDTPFLPLDLVERLVAAVAGGAAMAIAASAGRVHPIAALHPVSAGPALFARLAEGGPRRMMVWADEMGAAVVDFPVDRAGDPFANLNTPEDVQAAEARAAAAAAGP